MGRVTLALTLAALLGVPALAAGTSLVYPPAPRGDVTDTYFGTVVPDPYRWMENIDAPATVAWAKAENALTRSYLDAIPERAAIATAYGKLYDHPSQSAPFSAGTHWFEYRNTGFQTQSVLYERASENGPARPFFDPNMLSKDGSVQLSDLAFSRDGSLLAYATSNGGSDWETWHVKVVATGRDLTDRVQWSKYSDAAWIGDRGFYYEGYDPPTAANTTFQRLGVQKVWFHRLGTPQSADPLIVASTARPDDFLNVDVSLDGRLTYFERQKGNGNSLAWAPAGGNLAGPFRPVFGLDPDVEYDVLGNDGTRVYVRTNRNAPRYRVIALDLRDPKHAIRDVVPQTGDKLESARLVRRTLVLGYLHDAHSLVLAQPLDGGPAATVPLPGIGTASFGESRRDDSAIYYTFSSYAYPETTFRFDLATHAQRLTYRLKLPFHPDAFVTEQLFATSKDGTRVPVFVTHRKGIAFDGSNPTILYGYGGFDISWTPYFSTQNAMWLEMGGVYASVTLRGGGEYGEAWHDAGRLLQKQHVFDDFIAAAHLLIDRGITSTPKLAINGGSNGGLLVGAALTQQPQLFGAAIAEEGVLDMLRYQEFTVGKAWIPEYGSATASAAQFKELYSYSPLQNVRDGTAYPPTLILTADHDDRVFPAHSYKFAAALQHAQSGDAPVLLRVQTNEGHFAGLTHAEAIDLVADFYAFLVGSLHFTPAL